MEQITYFSHSLAAHTSRHFSCSVFIRGGSYHVWSGQSGYEGQDRQYRSLKKSRELKVFPVYMKPMHQPNGLKLNSSLCEVFFLKDFTLFSPAQSLRMHTKQAPKNKIPIKNWTRVIFLKHTVSLGENTRPTAEKLASM